MIDAWTVELDGKTYEFVKGPFYTLCTMTTEAGRRYHITNPKTLARVERAIQEQTK